MKYDALKKHANRHVRIRPALQRYDDAAKLEATLEDVWYLGEVSTEGVNLQNPATGHFRVLGLDHIHHYMEDPHSARSGGPKGVLVLNVQLLLFNRELLIEPVAPPGAALVTFVPTQTREDFLSAAKRHQSGVDLANAKNAYATSPVGIRASDAAFYDLLKAIDVIEATLRGQGNTAEITRKHFGFLIVIGAFGWWASINWEHYMNTLKHSRLTIRKWDGHPSFPNVMSIRKPNCVAIEQYTFGLVSASQAEWISLDNDSHHLSSMELVMRLLLEFMKNPLDPPSPWFE